MRHIRRKARPALLDHPEVVRVRDELAAFHLAGGTRQTQDTLDFERLFAPIRQLVREAHETVLAPTFGGYCAYTEQPVEIPELVLHRPPRDAMGLGDEVGPDHYFWLATDWDNWYQAAPEVARRKGPTFPVHGRRSKVPTADDAQHPRRDRALLLEPCADHPQWWLRAQRDGTWAPASHPADAQRYGDSLNRGQVTIDLLGLNEVWLVEQRRAALQDVAEYALGGEQGRLAALIGHGPYLGFRRQIAAQDLLEGLLPGTDGPSTAIRELGPELIPLLLDESWPVPPATRGMAEELLTVARRIKAGAAGIGHLRDILVPATAAPAAAPLAPAAPTATPPTIIRKDAYIASVRIRNFRCLDEVEIDLSGDQITVGRQIVLDDPEPAPTPAPPSKLAPDATGRPDSQVVPSVALLGENGSGKSTVLQAIAIAFAGTGIDDVLQDAALTWSDLLRRGTSDGEVIITFGRGEKVHLAFDRDGHRFIGDPPDIHLLVRGFGASRALAAKPVDGESETVEVSNLFNATRPIIDVDGWLAGLDEGSFNVAAATIREFLDLSADGRLERADGHLMVNGTPLRLLSDGYKSVIVLLCAIMASSGLQTTDTRSIRGVVMIDEIGAHLHPRWRMHVTRRLRTAFPQLQFLLSTHEPLCLRGMRANEVVRVFRSGADTPAQLEVVDRSPSAYRVDQLLTSEFFGLGTTIDPEEQQRWDAYYAALRALETERQRNPSSPNLATLQADANQLRGLAPTHGVLGVTRRDQMAYEVIDEYLSREPTMTPEQRRDERRKAIAAAADLYQFSIPIGPAGPPS